MFRCCVIICPCVHTIQYNTISFIEDDKCLVLKCLVLKCLVLKCLVLKCLVLTCLCLSVA